MKNLRNPLISVNLRDINSALKSKKMYHVYKVPDFDAGIRLDSVTGRKV